jgi:uncharacterized protein
MRFLNLENIPQRGLSITLEDALDWIGSILEEVSEVRKRGRLRCDLHIARFMRRIRIEGKISGKVVELCSRCLEEIEIPLDSSFVTFYEPPEDWKFPSGEMEIGDEDVKRSGFDGKSIDIADLLREQIYLSLPTKPLCKDDCKGICQVCGKNKNIEDCDCMEKGEEHPLREMLERLRKGGG